MKPVGSIADEGGEAVPFESVYRVSNRVVCPPEESVENLARVLGAELPTGYREYVTSLGLGTLCTFLIARTPDQVRVAAVRGDAPYRELFDLAGEHADDWDNDAGLDPDDLACAVVFAYAAAEAPIWFATRTRGPRLFEHVEGETFEIAGGFFGLVERCAERQRHEFPFFEPQNGRRVMRQLYVRAGVGRAGFVDAMARRWGREGLRCSRSSEGERYPHYFVTAIEGHFTLHLDPQYSRLPGDSFFVRASYDTDSEADLAAFVEPLLLPGGGPHESTGRPIWLP